MFNPYLTFSTSASPLKRAVKVFYKTVTDPVKKLEESMMKTGELELPGIAIEELHDDLKLSTGLLPPAAQCHRGWAIGLLDR